MIFKFEASKYTKKLFESIGLCAANWTFVTKGEFESCIWGSPTEESKLNHWVNSTLNQLVTKIEPSRR